MDDVDPLTLVLWGFSKLQKENEALKIRLSELSMISEMKTNLLEKQNRNMALRIKELEDLLRQKDNVVSVSAPAPTRRRHMNIDAELDSQISTDSEE